MAWRDESEWVPTLTKCWPFSNPSETHEAGQAVLTLPRATPSVPNTTLNKNNIEEASAFPGLSRMSPPQIDPVLHKPGPNLEEACDTLSPTVQLPSHLCDNMRNVWHESRLFAQQLGHSVQMLLSTYARWLNSSGDWGEME
jgi:hypothetical protein